MTESGPSRRRSAWLLSAVAVALLTLPAALLVTPLLGGCTGGEDVSAGTGDNAGPAGGGVTAPGSGVSIVWYGHSTFLITSPQGVRVLTDPYPGNMGYGNRRWNADVVTVSHEHFDHNSVASVEDEPEVLRGLDGGDWAAVSAADGDVTVTAIPGTYHDAEKGAKRGKNTLFLIEAGGLRLLHLGDLGAAPTADTVAAAGRVDVLLIPVGGFFTIDGPTARSVAAQFGAKVVIPMHYKTRAISDWQISDEKPFIEGQAGVKRVGASEVVLDPAKLPSVPEVWVLDPAPER